jgi:phosphoribosyl-AMP cyclohydrolase / phosphoribosyl-ATP pyrophosphohydrolase
MLIPSIDLMGGQAVQLIGGKETAIEAGDPRPIAARFGRVGPMAVIDLDAALGQGDNRALIEELCRRHRCRVGGGIRSVEAARRWLDAGAEHVILGTAATPEILSQLPKKRVLAALDAVDGEVVVDGWRTRTGRGIAERIDELRDHVDGFLVTFVEREGRLGGTALARAEELVGAAKDVRITIAGGVTTPDEIRALDQMGADAQVGMALYSGRLGLAEAFAAPLSSDRPDGLWPTVVVDRYDRALGMCYSNFDSLQEALKSGQGVYWSRRRGLWRKGATSGATQQLLSVDVDCDRDTLRFRVDQSGTGFCHEETTSCWGSLAGLPDLAETLQDRLKEAPEGSYTRRLFEDPDLLESKLHEEVRELLAAETPHEAAEETADVLYFALVAMTRRGAQLTDVLNTLDRRARRVNRRPGDAKRSAGERS